MNSQRSNEYSENQRVLETLIEINTFNSSQSSSRWQMPDVALQLSRIWNWLNQLMLGGTEPKISRVKNDMGDGYWSIYDPLTGRKAHFISEAQVREWLDRRYYE